MTKSYVETVSESIIQQLQQGTAPWVKPWQPGERFMPYNPTTGNEYKGMNALWLMMVSGMRGYGDSRWMTYKQVNAQEAQVNKGEKGAVIQFWQWNEEKPKLDEAGQPLKDAEGKMLKERVALQQPRIRSAVVFNADQISGLPEVTRTALPEWERHAKAEAILKDSGAQLIFKNGERAFYSPNRDLITLPERGQFPTADNFYATALHELGHWTGHESRLNRDLKHPFGSMGYAKEELRAEIASLMLGEQLGIGHDPGQHVAYIGSWIKAIEEDPREIFRAAADSEKMVKYLRGREMTQQQQLTEQPAEERTIQTPVLIKAEEMALRTDSERTYLDVPYAEKDEAKRLGARWDRFQKSWYVPAGAEKEPLQRWLADQNTLPLTQTPEQEFAAALLEAGFRLDKSPVMDGQLHRVPVTGDGPGERNGSYVGFQDGHPAGFIQNFKTGYESNWKASQPLTKISAPMRAQLEKEAAEKQAARAETLNALHHQTADQIAAHWQAATPVEHHPYLSAKGVQAHGLRVNLGEPLALRGHQAEGTPQHWNPKGELLIPIQDAQGKLWAAQSIDDTGRKSFPRGARIQGGYHVIGNPGASPQVLIAEGYATAATLHEATQWPVVVAFNSGNLPFVAEAMQAQYPEKTILIAGDNDHHKPPEKNVGRLKAEEAAQKVNGFTLFPQFEPSDSGTDWNDLHQGKGPLEVQRQIQNGLKDVERKKLTAQLAAERQVEKARPQELAATSEPEKQLVQSGGRSLSI